LLHQARGLSVVLFFSKKPFFIAFSSILKFVYIDYFPSLCSLGLFSSSFLSDGFFHMYEYGTLKPDKVILRRERGE
jgi:hypothetical protein